MWAQIVVGPHTTSDSADLSMWRSAHTHVQDLNTAKNHVQPSLTPLENGAGEFTGPQKVLKFAKKNWVLEQKTCQGFLCTFVNSGDIATQICTKYRAIAVKVNTK